MSDFPMPRVGNKMGYFLSFAIVGLIALSASWYTIDETERGVLLRNGALVGVVEPGLSFKIPFFESVKRISVQSHVSLYNSLQAYSKDQQAATLSVSVSWHVVPSEVAKVYTAYQTREAMIDRLISRQVPTQVENVFGRYNAVAAVQSRGQLVNDIASAIKASVQGPVVIDSVQVENIDFSDAYEKAVEARMTAEVQVKTREQQLATEQVQAQIRVSVHSKTSCHPADFRPRVTSHSTTRGYFHEKTPHRRTVASPNRSAA